MTKDTALAYLQGTPVELYDTTEHTLPREVVSVAVVHQATGRPLCQYRHPVNAHARSFQAFLGTLQPGRLLLLVGQSYTTPAPSVTSLLAGLGVSVPWGSRMGGMLWAWLGVVGGGGAAGGTSVSWHPQRRLTWELHLPKAPDIQWCRGVVPPAWVEAGDGRWAARVKLCTAYDGYGAWCTCPPTTAPQQPPNPRLQVAASTWRAEGVVTVVLASHPAALHRLLVSLATAGAAAEDILVFTPERKAPKELLLVCRSHGVHLEPTGRASDCVSLHVTRLFESALTASLILRPKATFFITVEDDMEVFPSFYRWMARGRAILKETQEFVCVNSLNPKYPYKPHEYPHRTLDAKHPLPGPWESTTTTTEPLRGPIKTTRDTQRSLSDTELPWGMSLNGRWFNNTKNSFPDPDKRSAEGDVFEGRTRDTRTPKVDGVVTGGGAVEEEGGRRRWQGGRIMAGWGAERTLVEAMIRFWPLAKRDVDWEALVAAWAGSRPCLTPYRHHARHARATHFSLGPDLPPLI